MLDLGNSTPMECTGYGLEVRDHVQHSIDVRLSLFGALM